MHCSTSFFRFAGTWAVTGKAQFGAISRSWCRSFHIVFPKEYISHNLGSGDFSKFPGAGRSAEAEKRTAEAVEGAGDKKPAATAVVGAESGAEDKTVAAEAAEEKHSGAI